ncbi:uncharacterized protein J3D65DRAFT_562385 [Phyllosticta citribraziliensis]|uniref:F-box domain-containing protein n=1 Tax=Phyllosticta citribraziliensis TaxID=989973 RepID=A0ABR1L369_9PEZI
MPIAYTSPVPAYHHRNLPLNLLALILSHVDEIDDLARITRTSRLLYYMTLPRLYEKVTLRSYSELRYKENGRPEGFGSGSPFTMGLNGLVTKNVARYVRSFRLVGEWRESDIDDFAKGRVPDNSMMLNIAVRAAMDRMDRMEHFGWELNTKPLSTIYQGAMACPSLTSLTLKFPNTRIPRPTVVIPPLPNLREFKALEIDPLCYPDDISIMLMHAKQLEALTMHFSPRMRDEGEESTNLNTYFGRCVAAKTTLQLRRFALVNLYTRADSIDMEDVISVDTLEHMIFINCQTEEAMTVFVDDTWRLFAPKHVPKNLKTMRGDSMDKNAVQMLGQLKQLETLITVSTRRRQQSQRSPSTTSNSAAFSPANDLNPPSASTTAPSPRIGRENAALAADYLAAITRDIGGSLRHLLLSDQWLLTPSSLNSLLRACPNLEQLGVAMEDKNPGAVRSALHHTPKLFALRLLMYGPGNVPGMDPLDAAAGALGERILSLELRRKEWDNMRWLGIADTVFYCGGLTTVSSANASPFALNGSGSSGSSSTPENSPGVRGAHGANGVGKGGPGIQARKHWNGGGRPEEERDKDVRRVVKRVDRSAVKDIEIWAMDSSDV